MNRTRRDHIITIEDPIEYLYSDDKCLVQQIEVGFDILDFKLAVRNALRQDPDVILFGELRDRETIETALHAVESGHLVLSTLHTPDAKQTILRILHYFPAEDHRLVKEQLALNLYGVMSQRLLRRADGGGMIPCCEILINTPIVRKLIREDRYDDLDEVLRNGEEGMQSFDHHLLTLAKNGVIEFEEALMYVHDEGAFRRAMKGKFSGGDRGRLISGA
jgi:twitching motility protein PilT